MSKRSIRKRRHVRAFVYIDGSHINHLTIGGIDITDSVKSVSYTDYRKRRRKVF